VERGALDKADDIAYGQIGDDAEVVRDEDGRSSSAISPGCVRWGSR
jgi:hypothetical protein